MEEFQIPFSPGEGASTPFSKGSFTSSVIGCGVTDGLGMTVGGTASGAAAVDALEGLGVERRMGRGATSLSFLSFTLCLSTQSGTLPMFLSASGFTCTVVAIS